MLRLGWWLAVLLPLAALAAEQVMRAFEPGEPRFWGAMAAVQALALFGYGCSSLPQWAGWKDETGGSVAVLERRLKIVQAMLVALLAGNCAYYGGYYALGQAEVACFLGAAVAAYGGDKFLVPFLSRLASMFQAAFGKS